MDLETVSKLVASHSSPEVLKQEKALARKADQQRMYQALKWGMICLILGMAVLTTIKTLALDKTYNLFGALLLFISMGLMCYSALAPIRDRASRSQKSSRAGDTSELSPSEAKNELPPARVAVPAGSITERTTQLIAIDDADTPRD
jgi:hypothetical protein